MMTVVHKQFTESMGTRMEVYTGEKLVIENIAVEVIAAIQGKLSPALQKALASGFFATSKDTSSVSLEEQPLSVLPSVEFEFTDTADIAFDAALTTDTEESDDVESLEKKLREMSVGHKIKLAYKGNKQVRSILIRDTNKSVSVAVIKSGRVSDTEAALYASNRNLSGDVIREISSNKDFIRKKPVRIALVGNSKTPIKVAMEILNSLDKKDLQNLAKNKNVPSVISKAALKRFKEGFRKS